MDLDSGGAPCAIVIAGAGPAGLAAASRLADQGLAATILEADTQVGGIAKTLAHDGNRMDLGGHRFFSRDHRVMDWWQSWMPLQERGWAEGSSDDVMLVRSRLSRIYFLRRFFDYPVSLTLQTLRGLGLTRVFRIGVSYVIALLAPIRPERSLEDFMVNHFGRELYGLFFQNYTEKVWGVSCRQIEPDWGAQRIRGISIAATIGHALTAPLRRRGIIGQDGVEKSLIETFLYPALGPGQLWEKVADSCRERGSDLRLETRVTAVHLRDGLVDAVTTVGPDGSLSTIECSHLLSTMPIRDLVMCIDGIVIPDEVRIAAENLPYRDFMTCGLLVSKLAVSNPDGTLIRDNWIYIQEPDVHLGRLQVFNNWSPRLVKDPTTIWLGLEYFCSEGDRMWTMSDEQFVEMATSELAKIGMIDEGDVLDSVVQRVPKAYPAYFGTYKRFSVVRDWLETVPNLFLMGRNGMHRYNNMDHSILSAWAAVDALTGRGTRDAIWTVNADESYQEEMG